MNGNPLKSIATGDSPEAVFNSARHNNVTRAVEAFNRGKTIAGGGASPVHEPEGLIYVRNDSGLDCPRFGVLGIQNLVWGPADNLAEFWNNTVMTGVVPTTPVYTGQFFIAAEAIPKGQIGRAHLFGYTPVLCEMVSATDQYADILSGEITQLQSGATGAAQIIWAPAGATGTQWVFVRLMPGFGASPPTIVRLDGVGFGSSGGTYYGPLLTGSSDATESGSANMPNGMTIETTDCLIVNIEESGVELNRCNIGSYALGDIVGKTAAAGTNVPAGAPIVMIRGSLGDLTTPVSLPTGTYSTPDGTSWAWSKVDDPSATYTAHAVSYSPITAFGYDGSTNASGSVVTTDGGHVLWFRKRTVTDDARGVTRKIGSEGISSGDAITIDMLPIEVVIDVSWDGTNLKKTKQTIYVIDYNTAADPVDVDTATVCTT